MNNTVLISGANGSLGSAMVQCFLQANWNVVALVRSPGTQNEMPTGSYREEYVDFNQPTELISKVRAITPFHAVVHCVGGIQAGKTIAEAGVELFDAMMDINLRSSYALLHASVDELSKSRGCFIAVSAMSALYPKAGRAAYNVSKAGVISLIQSAAEEGRDAGFRAHALVPGILRTKDNESWAAAGEIELWTDPSDCAEVALALCENRMKAMNGAIVPMFGGLHP